MDPACYTDVGISCENVGYYPIGDLSFDMVSLGAIYCQHMEVSHDKIALTKLTTVNSV